MKKVAHYLQEHVTGEVLTGSDVRKYFSTDASVFTVTPSIIVYPSGENDVRKTARFAWQLAERGRVIPLTARGLGTDQAGAAIGNGIVIVFPAHMNKITDYDSKHGRVTVEPGLNYGKLQQALQVHDRFLPAYPYSVDFSTIGGAVANNASGEKSLKYGDTRKYVKGLRVVLANGEVIETSRLNKRDLNKKLGLSTFEGEIYRSLDKLFEEHSEIIEARPSIITKNTAGYDIWDIKQKDGSFDLTPLFVGSQGTLGLITEITLDTEVYTTDTVLIAAFFDDIKTAEQAIVEINEDNEKPSSMEMVDETLLDFIETNNPNLLKGVVDKPNRKIVLLIEFDDAANRASKRLAKRAQKILSRYEVEYKVATDPEAQAEFWKIRHAVGVMISHIEGNAKALPIIEDGIVPPARFSEYIEEVYALFKRNNLKPAIWGHAGGTNLHAQPLLDLAEVGDRQKVFKLIDEYYKLVIKLGGSTSGQLGDGRLRAPYLSQLYGQEIYDLLEKIKDIFDPYKILNPGVKIGVTVDDIKPLLRYEYSLEHLYNHFPRS